MSKSLMSQALDVNLIGAVSLRVKCLEVVLREEEAYEVEIQYIDFVTDFAPLFVLLILAMFPLPESSW